jgi:threonine synthase
MAMRYVSTRGKMAPTGFCDVLLEGLAPDGGLVVPQYVPRVDAATFRRWRALDYASLAIEVLAPFADDLPRADLESIVRGAYTARNFGSESITPLTPLAAVAPGLQLLELSNGPTLAFKDLAMQLLGGLFEYELARRGEQLNILGATSGDTGSAAEYAMRGRAGVRVFMLSPHGRMSAFQRAQMYSLHDTNIHNIAIDGTFDDCQDLVKAVSADLEFKQRLKIGTVNSINWARVLAQVVYYVHGWLAATRDESELVSFAIPSGNFGNILAGWIAKKLGVPIRRLVLATNENNVLDEFFRTGRYRVRKGAETFATSSPSMDISKASNFERFVFDVVSGDAEVLRELWWELDTTGQFDLSQTPYWAKVRDCGFASGTSTHADRLRTIRAVFEASGRIVDPHTADGIKVALEHLEPGIPMICAETAAPAKFAETIVEAIGRQPSRPASCEGIEQLPQRCERMPVDLARVKQFIETHAA